MTKTIHKEILLPQPPAQVWRALTTSASLAQWMFPNDFAPHVGHRFTFQVPPNPKVNFEGLTVHCQVLQIQPPSLLIFTWEAPGLTGTQVSFQLQPHGQGTRLLLEHAGFDDTMPWVQQAVKGAEYGWAKMLGQLPAVVAGLTN
jgi:uncharacterized protein YndB with AHSA1/START domain